MEREVALLLYFFDVASANEYSERDSNLQASL